MYEKEILAVYRYAGITTFPADLGAIVRAIGYTLKTYQETAKTSEQLSRMKKISKDAYVIRKHKTIYINDDVPYPGRKRFSIAHELGHLIMVTDDEDTVNDFASNLLAPRPIIFARQLKNADQIAKTFGLSISAANNALIGPAYVPNEKGFEIIDYFGERFSCPWPHNTVTPIGKPVEKYEIALPVLKQKKGAAPVQKAILDPERAAKYEAMRKKNQRSRKQIQKELRERSTFIDSLMDHDPKYNRNHSII